MTTNLLLIVLFAVIFIFLIFLFARRNTDKTDEENETDTDELIRYLKERIAAATSADNGTDYSLSQDEINRRRNIKAKLRLLLKDCTYGDIAAKDYVKSQFAKWLVEKYGAGEQPKSVWIERVIPFADESRLTAADKFDILLYAYKKTCGYDALKMLIEKYKLNEPKISDDGDEYYEITAADIEKVFSAERAALNNADKLNVAVQRVYQQFKGHGVIDEIRDMNIDGVSGGVSGVPESFSVRANNTESEGTIVPPSNYDSVWLMLGGINIHLSFLSFGSSAELIRVCENLYRYGNPGQLTENMGKMINRMKDGSRITVARPNFSESWVFLLRKFSSSYRSLDELYAD